MVSSRSKTAAEAAAQRRTTRAGAALKNAVVEIAKPMPLPTIKRAALQSKKAASKAQDTPPVSAGPKRTLKRGMYCLCEGTDDGTPMVRCEGGCKNWFADHTFSASNSSSFGTGTTSSVLTYRRRMRVK